MELKKNIYFIYETIILIVAFRAVTSHNTIFCYSGAAFVVIATCDYLTFILNHLNRQFHLNLCPYAGISAWNDLVYLYSLSSAQLLENVGPTDD